MSETQHIGRVIRERRLDLGMTQRKVAHESNISIRGLEEIELGDVDPKCSTVFRIAVVLRMDVGDYGFAELVVALPAESFIRIVGIMSIIIVNKLTTL